MAAVTAAVVVAGAAAATAAMQAKQAADAAGGGGSSYVAPTQSESLFSRGTQRILETERLILADANAQGKMIEPELYRALGLEPVYDRPEDPEYGRMSSELAERQADMERVRGQISDLKGMRGRGAGARQNRIRALKKERKRLAREVSILTTEVENRGSVGRRVVGFKPISGVPDPTGSAGGSFGGALDGFNASLARALAGEEPIDPTLKREFDDRERELRERLRRQMGPDFETSTGGSEALAKFDREKAAAFAQYNREQISTYSALAESRAGSLSALTGAKLQQLSFPSAFRMAQAQALEGAADARGRFSTGQYNERAAKGAARAEQRIEEAKADQAKAQAIGNILAGVGSAAGTAGALYGGSRPAQPATVTVPTY